MEEPVQLYKPGQDFTEVDEMEAFSYGDVGCVSVGADSQTSVEGSTPHDATVHTQTTQGKSNHSCKK